MSKEMTKEQARDTLRNAAWLGTNEDRERIEKAVELLCGEQCEDAIIRGVFEQVMWERDVAIDQLKELGYGFGEKPRTGHWIIISPTDMYCSECNEIEHLDTSRKFCAYCGTRMVGAQESEETDEDSD